MKTVRLFISSTFRDMNAERDHLVTVVFPELRERVEQLGLEFFDVDLRWGVPTKDLNGETANSWEYCRQWIDRVEPFFICILGQRYGWVPEPGHFRDTADSQQQQQEPRSITDLEVRYAFLDQRRKRRSYFYLRTTLAPESNTEFVDPPQYQGRLEQLKTVVRQCGRPVRDYRCRWTGQGFAELEEFGHLVIDDLWSGVLRDERYVSKEVWRQVLNADPEADPRYTDESQPVPRELWEKMVALAKPPLQDPLDTERQQMAAFAASRLRWFQGRTHELQQLTEFIQSAGANAPRLAVVAAAPGQGKSTLLARLHQQLTEVSKEGARNTNGSASSVPLSGQSIFLITHFVGATERSATSHALIQRLLDELEHCGIEWPADEQKEGEEPKRDFSSLCEQLRKRLGDYAGERRIVILLDALNQLTDGHNLHWLPARLGPSVCIVVSCVEDPAAKTDSPEARVLKALASRQPVPLRVPLGPLAVADVRTIVVEYLKEYCKELDREHVDVICRMQQAKNPLYLLVMLGELRTLGGNDMNRIVGERIAALSHDFQDTVALFRWVLQRLEVFGQEAVRWWCLYLAHGRVGMASHELADLLARKLDPNIASTALLIERGLRRYLLRRGGQLDFFHSQLRQAVMEQYGLRTDEAIIHSETSDYFDTQSWFLRSAGSQRDPNQRKCEELLHHRLLAGDHRSVRDLLFSFELNEAKIAAGLIYDLIDEYSRAYSALPNEAKDKTLIVLLWQTIQRNSAFLQQRIGQYPQALLQSCYNSLGYLCCQGDSSFIDIDNSPQLRKLLESWRESLDSLYPNSYWLRSRIQPLISPGTQLQTLCQEGVAKEGKVRERDSKILFSSDGAVLTAVSDRLSIRKFQTVTGKQTFHVEVATSIAHGLTISADGERIAGVCEDETVRMWWTNTGDEVFCVNTPKSSINHLTSIMELAFSPDGLVIAGGALDGAIRILGTRTGKELRCLRGNSRPIQCVTFSSSGSLLVTGSNDDTIRLWDATKQSRQLRCFRFHRDHSNRQVCFLPGDDSVLIAATSCIIELLDSKTGRTISRITEHDEISSFSVAISADGTFMVRRTHGSFQVFDLRRGEITFSFRSPFLVGDAIAISPDGSLVATGIFGGIGVWNLSLDAPCQTMTHERYQQGIEDICVWGSSGTENLKIVSASTDGSLCIWRYEQPFMKLVRKFTHQTDSEGIKFVTFSPDGRLFAVINSAMRYTLNTVSLYDANKNSLYAQVIEHSDGVHSDVLSGKFFERYPSVWALPEGTRIDIEALKRFQKCPDTGMPVRFIYTSRGEAQAIVSTDELAVSNLTHEKESELNSLQIETNYQPSIAEDGEFLIREAASGSLIAYYPAGLSRVQSIPIPGVWAASSRAGLEILSLENSSTKLW